MPKKLSELESLVRELGDAESRVESLRKRVQDVAEKQAKEATDALSKLGLKPKHERVPRALAAPSTSDRPKELAPVPTATEITAAKVGARNGRSEKILEFLSSENEWATLEEIAVGSGAGNDIEAKKLTRIALFRLVQLKRVDRSEAGEEGEITWRIAKEDEDSMASLAKHARAVKWAKEHPDDEKAKRILELNEQQSTGSSG